MGNGKCKKNGQKQMNCKSLLIQHNWNHDEVIVLINCKHKEHITFKWIIDPWSNMVLVAQKWSTIAQELQICTQSRMQRNGKMCKEKWNYIHGDCKKKIPITTKVHAITILLGFNNRRARYVATIKTIPWRFLQWNRGFPKGKED